MVWLYEVSVRFPTALHGRQAMLTVWEVCTEVRKKLPVRQVSEPRCGAFHLIILSQDAFHGGLDVLLHIC